MTAAGIGMRPEHRATWSIPAWYAGIALGAAFLLPRLEHALVPHLVSSLDPDQATAIFASVGSGMMALTAIVFSLTFVMVQFSATAYSPRLVLWIARDPVLWHSLGMFTATFLYALGAIAWVDRGGGAGTPFLSGWLVIALLVASVAMFVALMDRVSLLQVGRMLAFTGDHGRRVIEATYPPLESPSSLGDPGLQEPGTTLRHAGGPRVIQAVSVPALFALATKCEGTIVLASSVGDTLVEGTAIAHVHGAARPIDSKGLRAAFRLGSERTFEQDPKYAIRLLVDIAIKALSPAVNDPSTAVQALDEIEDLLHRLGRRRLEIGADRDAAGVLRVLVPHPSWEEFLRLAFDEIRYYGATSVQVMRRMKALAADLIAALPEERHGALRHWQQRLDRTISRAFDGEEEKREAAVEDRQGLGASRPPVDPSLAASPVEPEVEERRA